MKFRLSQRGIVLAEFAIALPLLILLLGALGIVTLNALKIAREQVADYTLETEAQYVIDRITTDARAAHKIEIGYSDGVREKIDFTYHTIYSSIHSDTIGVEIYDDKNNPTYVYSRVDVLDRRVYVVNKNNLAMNAKRKDDGILRNPIIGENSYGKTHVTQFNFNKSKLHDKILHVTLELQTANNANNANKANNENNGKKVKFSTSVYMPACKKIIYHGKTILDEE